MKAGKVILIVVAVVAVVTGVSSWLLVNNLDRMARDTIVEAGEELLKTSVSLESVEITVLAGKARLSGLKISNPEGFSSAAAITLGVIEVDIDLRGVSDELIVIENILIQDPLVNYEINNKGVSNIDALLANVEEEIPSSGSSTGLLIIDRLDFKGGTITATSSLKPDQQLKFDFPVVFMSDLGGPKGASPEQIGAEISEVLMDRIISAATRAGVNSLVEEQKEKLLDQAEEKLQEKLKDIFKKDYGQASVNRPWSRVFRRLVIAKQFTQPGF